MFKSKIVFLLFMLIYSFSMSEPLKIVCSTDNPKDSFHVLTLEKFDELLNKYSKGEIDAVIHYRGNKQFPAKRGEEVNVNMVMSGSGGVNATIVASGNAAQRAIVLNFLALPYIFPNLESAKNLFESNYMQNEVNDIIAEKHGMRALSWLIGGFRHMTNSKIPVDELKDMEGLVIRIPQNRVMVKTYESFGAKAKPVAWGDTFDALKTQKVDGQENPYNVIYTSKFWNANQKYVTNNGPFLWVGPILINDDFFQSFSRKHQKIIEKAALEAAKFEWDWIAEKNDSYMQALKDKGMQILELKDKDKWITAAKKTWPDSYKIIGYGDYEKGEKIVKKVLKNTK